MMRVVLLAGVSVLLCACGANYGEGGFKCTSGQCPSGYTCVTEGVDKICRKSGAGHDAAVEGGPNACAGKADGIDCSPTGGKGFICRNQKCVASVCGDNFVDGNNGEECDDNNKVPDDGCNECKFNCKQNSDCEDKNPCNGIETCDNPVHKCKPGQPAPDGTDCTLPGGSVGSCNGGVCATKGCGNKVREGTEECDDGNKVDGDGCNNDCKFSCHDDAECDDKDICTGQETCKKEPTRQFCVPGVPLKCDDGKICTADSCDPVKGCQNVPIDADKDGHVMQPCGDDCNDADPTMYPGAIDCPDGKDNDCNGKIDDNPTATGKCWVDADGDTFAPTSAPSIIGCTCPAGYTSRDPSIAGNADCQAGIKEVHPGQTAYFTSQYCTTGCPTLCICKVWSWDWNCSGAIEKQYGGLGGSCLKLGSFCFGSGWVGSVPECGVTATYQTCLLDKFGLGCIATTGGRTQACH